MDISKIVFGEKFTQDMPVSDVSPEGVEAITALLHLHGNADMRHYIDNERFWPEVWSWRWNESSGQWVGNLTKRIQSYCYKTFRRQLPPEVISEVGNLGQRYTNKHTTWVYDFNNTLDWNAGDFGDNGSCFWSEKPWCMPLLKEIGGFAIRVYDPENPARGIGRGLIIAYDPLKELGRDFLAEIYGAGKLDEMQKPDAGPPTLVVFNGYGQFRKDYLNDKGKRYGHMQSMDYARLLAQVLGQSYHKTQLSFNQDFTDTIYVNNDGTSSFLVGPDPLIRKLPAINITVDKKLVSKHKGTCGNCGRAVTKGPVLGRMRKAVTTPDGILWCEQCYNAHYGPCLVCESVVHRDGPHLVQTADGRAFMCDQHRATLAKACPLCENTWLKDDLLPISGKRRVCPACYAQYTRSCHSCHRRFGTNELKLKVLVGQPPNTKRNVRVCKACLTRQAAAEKKRGVAPKYLPHPDDEPELEAAPVGEVVRQENGRIVVDREALAGMIAEGARIVHDVWRPLDPAVNADEVELQRRLLYYERCLSADGLGPVYQPELMTPRQGVDAYRLRIGDVFIHAVFRDLHTSPADFTLLGMYRDMIRQRVGDYQLRNPAVVFNRR